MTQEFRSPPVVWPRWLPAALPGIPDTHWVLEPGALSVCGCEVRNASPYDWAMQRPHCFYCLKGVSRWRSSTPPTSRS